MRFLHAFFATLLCVAFACALVERNGGFGNLGDDVYAASVVPNSGNSIINTIAGGGIHNLAPAREASIAFPIGVARDTQGRGFFFIDDFNSSRLLRFANTTQNPVTLSGVTIASGQVGLIAGGGTQDAVDGTNPRDVYLGGMNGMVVHSTGNIIFFLLPILNSANVMAINLTTQSINFGERTLLPGKLTAITFANIPEGRSLAIGPDGKFYLIGNTSTPTPGEKVFRINSSGDFEIVAGGGSPPSNENGDGGPANQARITNPTGVIFDLEGNMLIAEGGSSQRVGAVRKVATDGFISTLVGDFGFLTGFPVGIAMNPAGNIYVALGNGQRIVQVSPGQTTPIAGNGSGFPCDTNSNPTCGDGGAALQAVLNLPGSATEIAFQSVQMSADANGLFIPDGQRGQESGYAHIRYINRGASPVVIAGTTIAPLAINAVVGSGRPQPYDGAQAQYATLNGPHGVAVDANGNLFIADTFNHRLRFVNRGNAPVTLFAGTPSTVTVQPGAIATLNRDVGSPLPDDRILTAFFDSMQGLHAMPNGILIADARNGTLWPPGNFQNRKSGLVRFLNTSASTVTFYPASTSPIQVPPGQVKVIGGRPPGQLPAPVDIGDGGPATSAVIFTTDIAADAAGNIYIADTDASRIRKINANTGIVTSILSDLNKAAGIAFDGAGRLLVADTYNNRIMRENSAGSGTFAVIGDATLTPPIQRPRDIVVDSGGRIYVASSAANRVLQLVAPNQALGTTSYFAGSGAPGYLGDGGPALDAQLTFPNPASTSNDQPTIGMALLKNDAGIVFADPGNDRVRQVSEYQRSLRVLDSTIPSGTNGSVVVAFDAVGDENTFGFSVTFDQSRLAFVSASLGKGLPTGTTLLANDLQKQNGRVGFAISLPFGTSVGSGTHQLLTLTFSANSSESTSVPVGFGDLPIPREFVRVDATPIPNSTIAFLAGAVNVLSPEPTRTVRAVGSIIQQGGSGSLAVDLVAEGGENGLAFSLNFEPFKLAFVSATLGPDVPNASLNLNTSQLANGRLGVGVALPTNVTLPVGTRRVLSVTFSALQGAAPGPSAITFGDNPVLRELVDAFALTLPVNFESGAMQIEPAYEGDTSPRPYGSGTLTLADWVQTGRLAIALDTAANGGEFQRADCAPRDTRGNGVLSLADWVQAGRYAAFLDPITEAAGPTAPVGFSAGKISDVMRLSTSAPRRHSDNVRMIVLVEAPSRTGRTYLIELRGQGDENAVTFSLQLPPSLKLISIVPANTDAAIYVDDRLPGRVTIALAMPAGHAFKDRRLGTIRVDGTGASGFSSEPVPGELVTLKANEVPVAFAIDASKAVRIQRSKAK